MNITFVGGGSLRIPPMVRAMLRDRRVSQNGKIRLYDLDKSKAELIAAAIRKAPEFADAGMEVECPDSLAASLTGADIVYITMGFRGRPSYDKAAAVCRESGFVASDNLSPTGAFLSLIGGPIILDIARAMETCCPNALMLDFANPVAVFAGMVNNHTRIRCMGLCGGHFNHRYDLPRLMGEDQYDSRYEVVVAGVNHMSFILSGTRDGQCLTGLLDDKFRARDWRPALPANANPVLSMVLNKMRWLYQRFGHIVFSSETDGFIHISHDELLAESNRLSELARAIKGGSGGYPAPLSHAEFAAALAGLESDGDWESPKLDQRYFGIAAKDLAVIIMGALAGGERVKIAASNINNGAVKGFPDRVVLEYSQWVDAGGIGPVSGLELPLSLHALVAPLADFQTLLGDAIATGDPRVLAEAMWTYPIHHGSERAARMFKELLLAFKDDINPDFQNAKDYL